MQIQEGEIIVAKVRQHWFIMVQSVVVVALVTVVFVVEGIYLQFNFFGYQNVVYLIVGSFA